MKRARARLIREATEWRCEWRRAEALCKSDGPICEGTSLSLSSCRPREAEGEEEEKERRKKKKKKKPSSSSKQQQPARAGCQLQKQCRHRHRRDKHAFIPDSVVCARRRGRMRYGSQEIAHARVLYGFLSWFIDFIRSVVPLYIFFSP